MTNPSQIADFIKQTAEDGSISETDSTLVFQVYFRRLEDRDYWLNLKGNLPEYLQSVYVSFADFDGDIDWNSVPDASERIRVSIEKKSKSPLTLRLFLSLSLSQVLDSLPRYEIVQIADLPHNSTFSSEFTRFQLWTRDEPEPFSVREPATDPRELTRDFSGRGVVPTDIRPWLLRSSPTEECQAFEMWNSVASRRLLAALSDSVSCEGTEIIFHFNGPPVSSLRLSDDEVLTLDQTIHDCSAWVFYDGSDTAVRHLLVASEWARHLKSGVLSSIGPEVLDSAKSAYRAYVLSEGRKALQALSALRQTVLEESQKIGDRAQAMSSAIWKDMAIAFSPLVLRNLINSGGQGTSYVTSILSLAIFIYICHSFWAQWYVNSKYFKSQKVAREIWKSSLNTLVKKEDLEELSEKPLADSLKGYQTVLLSSFVIYCALSVFLLFFALVNFALGDFERLSTFTRTVWQILRMLTQLMF